MVQLKKITQQGFSESVLQSMSYPSAGTWDKKTSRSVTLFNAGMDDVHSSLTFIVLPETFFLFLVCSRLFSFHEVAKKLFLLYDLLSPLNIYSQGVGIPYLFVVLALNLRQSRFSC
jgi:hypothetical protein